MGRQNNDQGPLFYEFRLDEAVPADHLARQIDAVLDLSWVHAELAPHYPTLGRPSVDPVLMIRMLIIGRSRVLAMSASATAASFVRYSSVWSRLVSQPASLAAKGLPWMRASSRLMPTNSARSRARN